MTTSGGEAAAADDGAVEAPTVADSGLTEPAGVEVDTAGAEQATTTTATHGHDAEGRSSVCDR